MPPVPTSPTGFVGAVDDIFTFGAASLGSLKYTRASSLFESGSTSGSASNVSWIGNTDGFNPLGISVDPTTSQEGRLMMQQLRRENPKLSYDDARDIAIDHFETGSQIPVVSVAKSGDVFYKAVPAGQAPSATTPFWMDAGQAKANGIFSGNSMNIGSMFGLPNQTSVSKYNLYQMTVQESKAPLIFKSDVAPVVHDGVFKSGSAGQSIIPQRSAFTTPTPVLVNGKPLIIRSTQ